MNVKLKVLTAGVLFFIGGQVVMAQKKPKIDTAAKEKKIEEVVILGYSKTATKAKDVTASTTISSEVIENRPNVSFLNSLQGAAPGISVASFSGSPGSAKIDVIIRGLSSLNAATTPLYVIDGLSSNSTQFRNINPNDIESISVLKDAAATSIYGNRGANGVVIINTKQGKFNSGIKFSYSGTTGMSVYPKNKYEMANAKQALTLDNLVGYGLGSTMTPDEIANFTTNTDWNKYFFHPALTQQHDLGVSFGGEKVSVYTSLGYLNQGGLVPTTDFKRFTLRNNIRGKSANDRFSFNSQIAVGYSKRNQLDQEVNSGINANVIQNPLHGSLIGLPYLTPNQFNNGYDLFNAIGTSFSYGNNIYVLEDVLKRNSLPSWFTETSLLANIAASYKVTPALTLSNKAGIDYKSNDRVFARSPWSYLALAVQSSRPGEAFGGFERVSNDKDFTFNNVVSLNYSKLFNDKHNLDLGVYFEYMKAHYLFNQYQQNGLDPRTYVPGAGTGYVSTILNPVNGSISYAHTTSASKIDAGSLAAFATLDYDYAGKYGLSGVVRRDASYRFVNDLKWATFWSAAGRWNIDKEEFMNGSTFDLLKLRASYGTQGNQNLVDPVSGFNPIFLGSNLVRDLSTTAIGYNNVAGSFYTSQVANVILQWEEISQFNVGLDFRLLGRRLEGNVDYYIKKTNQLYNDVNSSAINGFYVYQGNNGGLKNQGIEGLLRYRFINKDDAKLSLFVNVAYNKNTITNLENPQITGSLINEVGGTAYQWNLYHYVGVNPDNGNLLFLDKDGNNTEAPTDADRIKTGKSYLPKYQGGFGLNAEYKGFFLDTLFSFQKDTWKYDNELAWIMDPGAIGDYNVSSQLLNAWSSTNTTSNVPSLFAANVALDGNSDRYLTDASFLRFKSFTVGYSIPSKKLANTPIKSFKIFVQGENMFVWTKWKGFDPEGFTTFPLGAYPNPRTISLGTNIEF